MKQNIHPTWYPQAEVVCACGNTWTTGATVQSIRTDICSKCHPFYTGEQRIVDTEGQVDRFLKRLQVRDAKRTEVEERVASRVPQLTAPLSTFGLNKRYVSLMAENGVNTVGDFIGRLEQGGEQALLDIPGLGRKAVIDTRKALRDNGYTLPVAEIADAE